MTYKEYEKRVIELFLETGNYATKEEKLEFLNEELLKKLNTSCSITNIGDVISSDILENKFNRHCLNSYINNPFNSGEDVSNEKILELQTKKRLLSDKLIDGEKRDKNIVSELTKEDIKNLLSYENED